MPIDHNRVDEATLALLYLGLHAKGLLVDPRNKAKSVVFTDEGLVAAEAAFAPLLGED